MVTEITRSTSADDEWPTSRATIGRRALRLRAVVVLAVLAMACGRSTPTGPTDRGLGPAIPSPAPPATTFPPALGPSRVFTFDRALTYRVSDYTARSRFVLYDNGAFALQYISLGAEYRGRYMEANGIVTFEWEGWSVAGPWEATGTFADGWLTVRYNLVMELSDFEDAVYRPT